jgi:Zn-dependent protease
MFGPVQPTAYDLQFSLLGIPVRVLPWFWLTSVLLGFDTVRIGPEFLLAWVGIVFASILVHELGHARVAGLLGYPARIVLYHFGGLAIPAPGYNHSQGRSILILLAGPGAGFLVGLALYLLGPTLIRWGIVQPPRQGWTLSSFIVEQLFYVNVWWGLVNLLPVLPLDGGQICRDVCTSVSYRRGERWAVMIAVVTAVAVAAWAFREGRAYIASLFGFMALQNFEQLQRQRMW